MARFAPRRRPPPPRHPAIPEHRRRRRRRHRRRASAPLPTRLTACRAQVRWRFTRAVILGVVRTSRRRGSRSSGGASDDKLDGSATPPQLGAHREGLGEPSVFEDPCAAPAPPPRRLRAASSRLRAACRESFSLESRSSSLRRLAEPASPDAAPQMVLAPRDSLVIRKDECAYRSARPLPRPPAARPPPPARPLPAHHPFAPPPVACSRAAPSPHSRACACAARRSALIVCAQDQKDAYALDTRERRERPEWSAERERWEESGAAERRSGGGGGRSGPTMLVARGWHVPSRRRRRRALGPRGRVRCAPTPPSLACRRWRTRLLFSRSRRARARTRRRSRARRRLLGAAAFHVPAAIAAARRALRIRAERATRHSQALAGAGSGDGAGAPAWFRLVRGAHGGAGASATTMTTTAIFTAAAFAAVTARTPPSHRHHRPRLRRAAGGASGRVDTGHLLAAPRARRAAAGRFDLVGSEVRPISLYLDPPLGQQRSRRSSPLTPP